MIAVWWQQYGEFVELRFYRNMREFKRDRADVMESFTTFEVLSVARVTFN